MNVEDEVSRAIGVKFQPLAIIVATLCYFGLGAVWFTLLKGPWEEGIGRTEEQLTSAAIPYEVGISRYRELARGQILGDSNGMLKLLISATDHTLLGVHAFGTGATELVHIGQLLMTTGGTVEVLVDTIFNYPTLAESYKVAALDAMNRLRAVERLAA